MSQSAASPDPLLVVFQMVPGDVWTDQEGIDWELTRTDVGRVHFSRVVVTSEQAIDVARLWRRREFGTGQV